MCIDEKTSLGCEGFCTSIQALEKENQTLKAWNEYYQKEVKFIYDQYMILHQNYMLLSDRVERKTKEMQDLVDNKRNELNMKMRQLETAMQYTLKSLHSED